MALRNHVMAHVIYHELIYYPVLSKSQCARPTVLQTLCTSAFQRIMVGVGQKSSSLSLFYSEIILKFAAIKQIEDMTAVARKLLETPMAPYSRLLQGMSREDKKIVIMFLTESLAESAEEAKEFKLSKEERKRGLMSLAGCWKDNPEDAAKMEAAIKDGRKNEFMREINLDE